MMMHDRDYDPRGFTCSLGKVRNLPATRMALTCICQVSVPFIVYQVEVERKRATENGKCLLTHERLAWRFASFSILLSAEWAELNIMI
jgi:hypothetical protein